VIEEECKAALRPKHICIVLPSILNRDLVVRAREAERDPEEVLANMADWQEQLARLQQRLEPRHKLEVRTTLEPHRYHAIFSESEAIFGLPWHSEATLNTSSFFVRCDTTGLLAMLHKDFEVFFRKCTPYQIGDNARLRKENAARTIDEEVLHTFGRRLPQVLRILEYIVSFPAGGRRRRDEEPHPRPLQVARERRQQAAAGHGAGRPAHAGGRKLLQEKGRQKR
jgi:hypothetical protein